MILIQAPILSESGYGHKAREISYALYKKYGNEVKILPTNWGGNINTGLDNSKYIELKNCITNPQLITQQPDLFIVIGVPEDIRQLVGKKNILFTSGVEVDTISPKWIELLNSMNLDCIIVPSNFVKKVMETTFYTKNDGKNTRLQLNKKVIVVPESYDDRIFETLSAKDKERLEEFNLYLESNNIQKFIFTSGQVPFDRIENKGDRKGFRDLYIAFKEQFKNVPELALVGKINALDSSYFSDYYFHKSIKVLNLEIKNKNQSPFIHISGYLSPQLLYAIMSHPKNIANIYPTKGEGFGRMILEALLTNKPLYVPKEGAFLDFTIGCLNVSYMEGYWKQIPLSATMGDILVKTSKWYEIGESNLKGYLKNIYKNSDLLFYDADANMFNIDNVKNKFSFENVQKLIVNAVEPFYIRKLDLKLPSILSNSPKTIDINNLPKINK